MTMLLVCGIVAEIVDEVAPPTSSIEPIEMNCAEADVLRLQSRMAVQRRRSG